MNAFLDDRGALSPFVVIFAVTVFVLAGLVVDGGLAISKREQAADIAEQAARYAADDLDDERLRAGRAVIDDGACPGRALDIVEPFDRDGASIDDDRGAGCEVLEDGASVRVRVKIRYEAALLSLVGLPVFTARAEAVARPAAGILGEEGEVP